MRRPTTPNPTMLLDASFGEPEAMARVLEAHLGLAAMWGFTNSYCSSLIHDINAVHGMLDVMGIDYSVLYPSMGLGLAMAKEFAASGADVAILARRPEVLDRPPRRQSRSAVR